MKNKVKNNSYFNTLLLVFPISVMLIFVQCQRNKAGHEGMVLVPGGTLTTIEPLNSHMININIESFLIDKDLVTVADFEAFVNATGYVTEAERFGNSGVFDFEEFGWKIMEGANYRYPFGPQGSRAQSDHPVTQVSWNDANAYAQWRGKRLPTQWEWEWVAKNASNSDQRYTWGESLTEGSLFKANVWQGSFPYINTEEDGFLTTSPVGYFGRNALGVSDMGGNVWQWCEDDIHPTAQEQHIDPGKRKVIRGGSFLCDPKVCHGYRVTGRASSTPESGMVHIGFRCAKSIKL